MSLKTNADKIKAGYIDACNAILARGGYVPNGMPIGELDEAIKGIPRDQVLAYYKQVNSEQVITVPHNAEPYARIGKIGGMTYKSDNLLHYPYYDTTKTVNGITFTDNGDGTITANGTATADADFSLMSAWIARSLNKGTYRISGGFDGGGFSTYNISFGLKNANGDMLFDQRVVNKDGLLVTLTEDATNQFARIRVYKGATVNNLVIKPMLNEGSVALPYSQFFNGLRNAAVSEMKSKGANSGHLDTLPIPQEVQALDGYGGGLSGYPNEVDFDSKKFVRRTYRKVFDGTENILDSGLNAKGQSRYAFSLDKKSKDSMREILCVANHYPNGTVSDTYSNSGNVIGTNENYIRWIDSEIPIFSLADMRAKLKAWYDAGDPLIVDYVLAEPIETDISAYLTDEFVKVESDGTITAVNEHNYDMPTEVNYIINTVGG